MYKKSTGYFLLFLMIAIAGFFVGYQYKLNHDYRTFQDALTAQVVAARQNQPQPTEEVTFDKPKSNTIGLGGGAQAFATALLSNNKNEQGKNTVTGTVAFDKPKSNTIGWSGDVRAFAYTLLSYSKDEQGGK